MGAFMDNLLISSKATNLICENGSVHQSPVNCSSDCSGLQTEKQTPQFD